MLLLAFDTATPAVTVALHDGRQVLAESVTVDARRQGELLATSVEKVLAEAGAVIGDAGISRGGLRRQRSGHHRRSCIASSAAPAAQRSRTE